MTESYAGALPGSSRLTLTEPRAAVADPRAESLCLGQRDELLAGAGGRVRPRAATKWAAFFRQNSSCIVRGFMGISKVLRWVQTAAGTTSATLNLLTKYVFL